MHLQGENSRSLRRFVRYLKPPFDGVWIQGGAARTLFNNDPLKDIDVLFRDQTACNAFREHLYDLGLDDGDRKNIFTGSHPTIDTTIDTRFFKSPHEVNALADFNVCAFTFDFDLRCTYNPEHMEQLLNRELFVLPNFRMNPPDALRRAFRMLEKGYTPPNDNVFWGQIHKYIQEMP